MQKLIAPFLWQSPERFILMFPFFFNAGLTFPDFGVASGFLRGAHNCMIKGVRVKPGNISRWVGTGWPWVCKEKEEEDTHCGINKGSILSLKGLAVK